MSLRSKTSSTTNEKEMPNQESSSYKNGLLVSDKIRYGVTQGQIFAKKNKMDWYSKWVQFRGRPILPLTQNQMESTNTFSDTLKWIRNPKCMPNRELDVEDKYIISDRSLPESEIRHRKTGEIMSVAFPSYLNTHSCVGRIAVHRRSSLLDGAEQTIELITNSSSTPKLTYPKHSIRRTSNFEVSHLPVPIIPIQELYGSNLQKATTGSLSNNSNSVQSTSLSIVGIVFIFLCSLLLLIALYRNFPELSLEEKEKIKLPKDMGDAKELGRVLSKYKDTYYLEVMSTFFITYIFLQTFAIPGSVFLSILSGFLYPFYIALFLVCLCSGIGATGCYLIFYFVGKPLVNKYLSERVENWNATVDGHREHLFNYLLFLRITPFLPNWFINIVSPVIKIPISTFFVATFIGVAPLSFIAIQAGTTLYQLTTAGDAISWTGIGVMAMLAIMSLIPVLLKNKLKNKFE